ncbi:hypothetical protein SAMD00019534_038070 [Acytostelium subglobosum LB1]|uniref:hypothetical protein n=1 Tax=Acytostelium subglobosum LB1 TaxID=1410327 RepID=UPI00064522DE|nr:hypothetical protein SAMD00019534_038070 [Acytostelium subglobosum LB1]GAM20632.1 hypothetical protein SAMD00019534_038070 [Acytostelium subglobosum LB1]|eukprot:XP_012760153.1 hypothetical protein SAMD00019534_038070 [Acytostelium subglobosum LB1]
MITVAGVSIDKTTPVNFNVGGTLFATSLATVFKCPQSILCRVVEMQIKQIQKEEVIFIDRNPTYFGCLLDYLRTSRYNAPIGVNTKALLEEAEFFNIKPLVQLIQDEPEMTRCDIINIINSCYDYPRLQGIWMSRLNFTGLDLSCALFNYSNLSRTIFKMATINQASFSGCNLEFSSVDSCIGSNCVFNRAKVTNAIFTDNQLYECQAYCTNFSNSNLSNTSFACSDLKGSKFIGAILYGCDFSHCDIAHCDFTNAKFDQTSNLSCTITKETVFENSNYEVAINKKNWKKPKQIRTKGKISSIPGMIIG